MRSIERIRRSIGRRLKIGKRRSTLSGKGVRVEIIKFLEENAGRYVQVNEIVEKVGVKRGSVYAVLSDLRKLGMLPKPGRTVLQPVPLSFNGEEALEALRALQRGRYEKRKEGRKSGV